MRAHHVGEEERIGDDAGFFVIGDADGAGVDGQAFGEVVEPVAFAGIGGREEVGFGHGI